MTRRPDLTTPAWKKLRLAVLERDGWACTSCGKGIEGKDAHVDHIIPFVSVEESNHMHNLRALCSSCNSSKQDKVIYRLNWINKKWLSHL